MRPAVSDMEIIISILIKAERSNAAIAASRQMELKWPTGKSRTHVHRGKLKLAAEGEMNVKDCELFQVHNSFQILTTFFSFIQVLCTHSQYGNVRNTLLDHSRNSHDVELIDRYVFNF